MICNNGYFHIYKFTVGICGQTKSPQKIRSSMRMRYPVGLEYYNIRDLCYIDHWKHWKPAMKKVNFYQSQGSTGMTSDAVTPGNKQAKQPHPTYPLTRVTLFWFLGVWCSPYACTHCRCYNTWLASGVLLFAPGPALHLLLSSCHYPLWFGELKDKMSLFKTNIWKHCRLQCLFPVQWLWTAQNLLFLLTLSWYLLVNFPLHFEIETSCWSGQPAHRMTALDVHHDLKQCL